MIIRIDMMNGTLDERRPRRWTDEAFSFSSGGGI